MLYIYVLEDDFQQQAHMEKVVDDYVQKHGFEHEFMLSGKPEQLLESIKGKGSHQVFFLDIEIKKEKMKGLEVARAIRERDSNAIIAFITTHSELMPLTFKYQVLALDFIDKNLKEALFVEKVGAVLDYAQKSLTSTVADDAFFFENRYSRVQLPFNDIHYIEVSSISHKLILHGKHDYMEFYGTLDEIERDKRFLRVHRSFAINPANVVRLDKQQRMAYFPNKGSCLVSRTKMKELERQLSKLHKGKG
ncbi:LytTR family transcriptional regulator DNA-binding domain-containing protein [Streptococcus dentasini]